jgi:hypothetical protein
MQFAASLDILLARFYLYITGLKLPAQRPRIDSQFRAGDDGRADRNAAEEPSSQFA